MLHWWPQSRSLWRPSRAQKVRVRGFASVPWALLSLMETIPTQGTTVFLSHRGVEWKPESRPKDSGGTADGEAQPGFYHWDHTPPTHLLLRAPPHPCTPSPATPRLLGAGEVVKLNVSCDLGQPYFSAGWEVSGSSWQPGPARGSGEGSGRRGDGGAPECRPGK